MVGARALFLILGVMGCAPGASAPSTPVGDAPKTPTPVVRERAPLTFQTSTPAALRHDVAIPATTIVQDVTAELEAMKLPEKPTRTRVLEGLSAEGGGYQAYVVGEAVVRWTGRTSGESYDRDLDVWYRGGWPRYVKVVHHSDPTKFMESGTPEYKEALAARSKHTYELYFQGDRLRGLRVDGALAPTLKADGLDVKETYAHVQDVHALMQIPEALFVKEGYQPWTCAAKAPGGRCLRLQAQPQDPR